MAASDEIKAYNGWAGSDSPLYGLKLFFQSLDESISGDANAKIVKQMAHAEERLSEAYAMALNNNTGAMDAALNGYDRALDQINTTMDDTGIDESTYVDISRQIEKHQNHFKHMINNSTMTEQSRNSWANAFDYSEQFKNGRPFIYCNDMAYFVPPGQMKKMGWSHVPQGLAKKGFQSPEPTIVDGQVTWPWDEGYDYSYQYDNSNGASIESNNNSYNNSYEYLSPGPHGNSSGNGNGNVNVNGNGNGKK